MSDFLTPAMTEVLINGALLLFGLALKSYFPAVFPFFDQNKATIKELVKAIDLTPVANKDIAKQAEEQGLNKAATLIKAL